MFKLQLKARNAYETKRRKSSQGIRKMPNSKEDALIVSVSVKRVRKKNSALCLAGGAQTGPDSGRRAAASRT